MEGLERWRDKLALVTGASAGIGRATATALAGAGLRVVLAARDGDRLAALAEELAGQGGEAHPAPTDLRDEGQILALFERVRQEWGGLDVLVNNAGLGVAGALADGRSEDWREVLDVNVLACSICMREARRQMEGRTDAAIVNISSLAGHRYLPDLGSAYYSASKHAVRVLTDAMRAELAAARSPIKIGTISPGLVRTEFHARASRGTDWSTAKSATHEFLRPEDIAREVLHLLAAPRGVQISDIAIRPIGQVR